MTHRFQAPELGRGGSKLSLSKPWVLYVKLLMLISSMVFNVSFTSHVFHG